jgi:DNA-binding LacI/PurR family transcriptional regulator
LSSVMPVERRKPAVDVARVWLAHGLDEMRARGEVLLPSARETALSCGVSHVSALKALRALADDGVIVLRQGTVARLAGTDAGSASAPDRNPLRGRARVLADQLGARILHGAADVTAELQSPKQMQARYGVCYRTLRSALHTLQVRGFVTRYKRGYRVAPLRSGGTRDAIVFITRGDESNSAAFIPPRGGAYLQALDRLCSQAGARALVSCQWYVGRDSVGCSVDWADRNNHLARQYAVLGFVVMPTALPPADEWLIPKLVSFGAPVAVIDERPVAQPSAEWSRLSTLWIEAVNSYRAGQAIGRYLLQQGHRKVAFLCPFANRDWSLPRLQGVQDMFRAAGFVDGVVPYLDVSKMLPEGVRDAMHSRTVEQLIEAAEAHHLLPSDTAIGRKAVLSFVERVVGPVQGSMRWAMAESLPAAGTLFSLAGRALRQPDITAWVGSNAMTALLAMDFLTAAGKRVPRDVSVVGFDDTDAAAARRLTTYSFNPGAAVQHAVHHVLGAGARTDRRARLRQVSVEGYVSVRASCASLAN